MGMPITSMIDKAHNARNMCNMKNLTLRIDEKLLDQARRTAMEQGTSVNSLIREYLEQYVVANDRREQARKNILEMCEKWTVDSGGRTWTREELYDR